MKRALIDFATRRFSGSALFKAILLSLVLWSCGMLPSVQADFTYSGPMNGIDTTGTIFFGYPGGTGTATLSGGTIHKKETGISMGLYSNESGILLITGAGSIWTASTSPINGNVTMGTSGSGYVTIADGGTFVTRNVNMGYGVGGHGTATISGAGSQWLSSAAFNVGSSVGYGSLLIADGGKVSASNSSIAAGEGFSSSATVSGVGSLWTNTGGMSVGNTGTTSLLVDSGGIVTAGGNLFFGAYLLSNSTTVTVKGAGSVLSASGLLQVSANTTINILDGGKLITGSYASMSNGSDSAVLITVSGSGSLLSSAGVLYLGYEGNVTTTVSDGGKVRASTIILNLDGGTDNFTSSSTLKIGTGGAAGRLDTTVVSGGSSVGISTLEFNHNETNYYFTNDAGDGIQLINYLKVNVLKGTTIFTGDSSYNGATTIYNGATLIVDNPGTNGKGGAGPGPIVINPGGTFQLGNYDSSGNPWYIFNVTNNGSFVYARSDDNSNGFALITGTGSVTLAGSGGVRLNANNSYSGGTFVKNGVLFFAALGELGTGNLTLDGGSIKMLSSVDFSSRLDGIGSHGGTIDYVNHHTTLSSNITGVGGLTVTGTVGSGGLGGTGQIALTLAGDNSYQGGTTMSGSIRIANDHALGTGALNYYSGVLISDSVGHTLANAVNVFANMTISGPSALTFTGVLSNVSASTSTSISVNNTGETRFNTIAITTDSTSRTLRIDGNDNTHINSFTQSGGGVGNLSLRSGNITLDGISSHTGTTTVQGTHLVVNGSIASSSLLSIQNFSTLAIHGTVGSTIVGNTSSLNSNNAPGLMTVEGNLTLQGSATFDLFGTDRGDLTLPDGSGYDAIDIGGSGNLVSFGGVLVLLFDSASNGRTYTYDLIDAGTNTIDANQHFSGITVMFADTSSGSIMSRNGQVWTTSSGGTSYEFNEATGQLAQVVPEPSTYALLGLGLLAFLFAAKTRRFE